MLSEINQIKQCLQEHVVTKEEEENLQNSQVLIKTNPSKKRILGENGENKKNEPKVKREKNNTQRGNSETFDLSEFITNYLNKTYKNVIENSS